MSWSVAAVGKAHAVGAEIAKQFSEASQCDAPEENIRHHVREAIEEIFGFVG